MSTLTAPRQTRKPQTDAQLAKEYKQARQRALEAMWGQKTHPKTGLKVIVKKKATPKQLLLLIQHVAGTIEEVGSHLEDINLGRVQGVKLDADDEASLLEFSELSSEMTDKMEGIVARLQHKIGKR